jgi:hypothetical protein
VKPTLVPGQVPGVAYAVVELIEGQVERVEVHATRTLAVHAGVRAAGVIDAGETAAARRLLEEEGRYDEARGAISVQVVRVAHIGRTVGDTPAKAARVKGGAS